MHVESLKSVAPDRAERSHVGEAHAIEQAQKETHHVSGKHLMPVHAPSLAPAARSRRNHEVISSFAYWLNESIHHFRVVTAIAVKEDDDFAISRERAQPR